MNLLVWIYRGVYLLVGHLGGVDGSVIHAHNFSSQTFIHPIDLLFYIHRSGSLALGKPPTLPKLLVEGSKFLKWTDQVCMLRSSEFPQQSHKS